MSIEEFHDADKLPLVHNSYHDDMYFNNAKLFLQEKKQQRKQKKQ